MKSIVRTLRRVHDFVRYEVPQGIENLIRWFPVVWQDRDFDQAYIYTILIRKLEHQSKCFRKYGICEGNDLDADRMDRCVLLLKRLRDDEDEMDAAEDHNDKWGELVCGENGHWELPWRHAKVLTPADKVQERKDMSEGMDLAQNIRDAEKAELYAILRNHLDEWWF